MGGGGGGLIFAATFKAISDTKRHVMSKNYSVLPETCKTGLHSTLLTLFHMASS